MHPPIARDRVDVLGQLAAGRTRAEILTDYFAPESLAAALEACREFRVAAEAPDLVHTDVVLEVRAIVERHAWGHDETKSIARMLEGNGLPPPPRRTGSKRPPTRK